MPERTRVLTLIRDIGPGYGGAEALAYEIARRLDRERFESLVATTRAPTADKVAVRAQTDATLRAEGVRTLALDRRSTPHSRPWLALHRFLRDERIDVVHAHMFRASIPGAVIGRLARVPVVVAQEHTWSYEGRPLRRWGDRFVVAPASDVFVAVSNADAEKMVSVERVAPEKVLMVPNGIPAPVLTGADVRSELGIEPGTPVLGALARLEWQKGYDVLVEAVALAAPALPGLQVLIAGEGAQRPQLEALISRHRLTGTLRLLGHRADGPDFLSALDAVVMPSRWEGSPLALVEAMALARPIVATAVGGVPDMITDGEHGLLVAPEDPAALADGIRRILGDPELAARLGSAAQQRQRRELSIEATVGRFERLYDELLGLRRAG